MVVMGAQHSTLPKGRRKSLRSFRKSASQQTNLSHTFTVNDNDNDKPELMNINVASEEELMTLSGINRQIAKSIVEHRKAIGRYRKVEDLALVVGADKLEEIRSEISVSTRKNHSCQSSRAQSYDSLKSNDSRLTIRSNRLVNVNKASVFELQAINGITQQIAAAIVHHRTKRGPFKQVDDLMKVKSIDRMRLANISRFLTVECSDESQENDNRSNILTNGYTIPHSHRNNINGTTNFIFPHTNGVSQSAAMDIFELLTAYSPRPILDEVFTFTRSGESVFRVATWNLSGFTADKVRNMGVREVICRTILENGWSIVAVQDVLDVSALRAICEELNKPKLRRISEWKDKNHNWNFCILDKGDTRLGFIYDSDGAFEIELVSLNEGPTDTKSDCEVVIAQFRVETLYLSLANVMLNTHTDFQRLDNRMREFMTEEGQLLVLIDFSKLAGSSENYLNLGGLKSILPLKTSTLYMSTRDTASMHHISNILYNTKVQSQLANINGVVRRGITHLAIPNGWSWGGPVSPYLPVWTELYINRNVGTAL